MRQEIGEGRNKNRRRWDEHRKGWEKMGIQGFLSSGDDRLDRRFLFTAEIDHGADTHEVDGRQQQYAQQRRKQQPQSCRGHYG